MFSPLYPLYPLLEKVEQNLYILFTNEVRKSVKRSKGKISIHFLQTK